MTSLEEYRSFDEGGASPFTFSDALNVWICGDSNGSIFEFSNDGEKTSCERQQNSEFQGKPIISMVVNPDGNQCVVGIDNDASVFDFPSLETALHPGVVRRTLPITHISYDSLGNHIFVASREPDIHAYSYESQKIEMKVKTHECGVATFCVSRTSKFISFIDMNGSVHINSLKHTPNSKDTGIQYNGSDMISMFTAILDKELCRDSRSNVKMSWHPKLPLLAAPSTTGSIVVFSPTDLSQVSETLPDRFEENFLVTSEDSESTHGQSNLNMVSFSSNGLYLISSDVTGRILLWNTGEIKTRDDISQAPVLRQFDFTGGVPLFDMVWGRGAQDNYVLVTTTESWARLDSVIHSGMTLPNASKSQKLHATAQKAVVTGTLLKSSNIGDDDDDTNDEIFALMEDTSSNLITKQADWDMLVASQEVSDTKTIESAAPSSKPAFPSAGRLQKVTTASMLSTATIPVSNNDFDDDDAALFGEGDQGATQDEAIAKLKDNAILASKAPRQQTDMRVNNRRYKDDDDDEMDAGEDDDYSGDSQLKLLELVSKHVEASKASTVVDIQKPFQPSESKYDEKFRRYLVWNHIGSITTREDGSSGAHRIEIQFSDINSGNKQEIFTDTIGYNKGCLSSEGAMFADQAETIKETDVLGADEDNESGQTKVKGSWISYHSFNGATFSSLNGANESFSHQLPRGENADVVAVGRGWCATATSKNYLRMFSSSGLEILMFTLKGPVVTMVGCESHLAVFYHQSHPINNQPRIAVDIYDINFICNNLNPVNVVVADVILPLHFPGARLVWAGFDPESLQLNILDSKDLVCSLMCVAGWQWIPVLDISTFKKSVDYIYWPITVKGSKFAHVLLNGESKPAVFPRPVTSVKNFKVPVLMVKEPKEAKSLKGVTPDISLNKLRNSQAPQLVWNVSRSSHLTHFLNELNAGKQLQGPYPLDLIENQLDDLDKENDRTVLSILQKACREQMMGMAYDLVHRLRTDAGLTAAIKIANNTGHGKIAEAVDEILEERRRLHDEAMQRQMASNEPEYDQNEADQDYAADNGMQTYQANKNQFSKSSSSYSYDQSQDYDHDDNNSSSSLQSSLQPPVNPFAVKASSSPSVPLKRKSALEGFQEMKGTSPSPKKPALVRTSSFTQQTILKKNSSQSYLK